MNNSNYQLTTARDCHGTYVLGVIIFEFIAYLIFINHNLNLFDNIAMVYLHFLAKCNKLIKDQP